MSSVKTNFNFNAEAEDAAPPGEIPLSELPPDRLARVTAIDESGGVGRRLADLGLVAETRVRMLRRAPLGDPAVYELRGYQLCLRRTEAARVRVRVEPRAPAPGRTDP